MTGYRRLISYIYAYEGEEKGKNIGFVKLESRNGQCRLSVNVKKIYAGGNDIGVYLIASGQEIPLGNIFIRNSCGEFRTIINVENVMGTGNSLDSCIGLVIHEKGEAEILGISKRLVCNLLRINRKYSFGIFVFIGFLGVFHLDNKLQRF